MQHIFVGAIVTVTGVCYCDNVFFVTMVVACLMSNLQPGSVPAYRASLFSDINISQGSVAERLRCGGIFDTHFIADLLLSLCMEIFFKI